MKFPEETQIHKNIEEEAQILCLFCNKIMGRISKLSQGKRRNEKGKLMEKATEMMCLSAGKILGISKERLVTNNLKIPYDHIPKNPKGELILSEINESKKKFNKNCGIGSDLFVYLDEKLVFVIEVKTYCDISMYKRCYSEFECLVSICLKMPKFILLQVENALGGDAHERTVSDISHTGPNPQSYDWNRRRLLGEKAPKPDILTLQNVKRCSKKEIRKEKTPFTEERMGEALTFIVSSLKNKIEEHA